MPGDSEEAIMWKETWGTYESGKKPSGIGERSGGYSVPSGPIEPAVPNVERPKPIPGHHDFPASASAKEHALGSEVKLTGLIGKKVSALRIPAGRLDPVTKLKFDGDDLLRHEYKAIRFDRDKAFLIKTNAKRDYPTRNSLASDYVQQKSDAAKNPSSREASQQDLHGDVIVVGYSRTMQEPIGLTGDHLTGLIEKLKVMRFGLSVEEDPETSSGEEPKQG
jgi:hypothetical protein